MHRKMLLSYAVPVIVLCGIVLFLSAADMLSRIREQTRRNMSQAVQQASSYMTIYIQDMEYIAETLAGNAQLEEILEDAAFGTRTDLMENYLEFYQLNLIFSQTEGSDSDYRVGLYVPDEALYTNNVYYFYAQSELTMLENYEEIETALTRGKEVFAVISDKRSSDLTSEEYLVLLRGLNVTQTDGTTLTCVIKVEIRLNILTMILDNAKMTEGSILYVTDGDGNILFTDSSAFLADVVEIPKEKDSDDWEIFSFEGKRFYRLYTDSDYNDWEIVSMIPVGEFYQQITWFMRWQIIIIVSILVVVVFVSHTLAKHYSSRIEKINSRMDAISKGGINLQTQEGDSDENSRDELDILSGNFETMVEEVRELMKEQYRLGRRVSQAQMQALQAQINPHFLYNTLDLINWGAMDHGADEVAELATYLGQFYRLSLNHGSSVLSIEDELRHVEAFINIENAHFDNAIALHIDVPRQIQEFACPNIILQPFVENSVLHGIGEHPEIERCRIEIAARQDDQDILFIVKDDGPGIDPETAQSIVESRPGGGRGYGIGNVNFRLKLTYGEQYGVSYKLRDEAMKEGFGTEARIRIRALHVQELKELMG